MDPMHEENIEHNSNVSGPIESQTHDGIHSQNVDDTVNSDEHDPSGKYFSFLLLDNYQIIHHPSIGFVRDRLCVFNTICLILIMFSLHHIFTYLFIFFFALYEG